MHVNDGLIAGRWKKNMMKIVYIIDLDRVSGYFTYETGSSIIVVAKGRPTTFRRLLPDLVSYKKKNFSDTNNKILL